MGGVRGYVELSFQFHSIVYVRYKYQKGKIVTENHCKIDRNLGEQAIQHSQVGRLHLTH